MTDNHEIHEPDGILIVDKPGGMTSHDVVWRVRRLFGTKKVGHTGTLDPMATGVLVVLLGRAAKACEYVSHDEKSYQATLRLGLTTDTEDSTGTVLTRADPASIPTEAQVQAALPSFTGEILQIPPMYSALKVDGRKLCDIARSGEVIEREARPVTVKALSCTPGKTPDEYTLWATVSGGTYIRTLCADLGAALGCGGVMASLRRTEAGGFSLRDAHTLDELDSMTMEERHACLRPVEELFANHERLPLPDFFRTLCRNGCEIYLKKLGVMYPVGTRLRLCDASGAFFALGEVMEYEDGLAVKAIKLFVL